MKQFLFETAESVLKKYKDDISSYCLVFPNKRTNFFFRKYYSQIYGAAHKPPKLIEINRLVAEFTKLNDIDEPALVFKLYFLFKEYFPAYSFDAFYKLGRIIISDFNEIDAWLIQAEQVYKNIKDLKEIDERFDWLTDEQKDILKNFWSAYTDADKSKEKKMFLELWNILPQLYKKLRTQLLNEKTAYNGLQYAYLVEMAEKGLLNTDAYRRYIFIGFNALNNAELKLFNYLRKLDKAEFYWDTDAYYHRDPKQEAGEFLRKNFHLLSYPDNNLPNHIARKKNIDIIGVSLNVGQAKILPELLNEFEKEELLTDTAIILADEQLLFPVISSLPEFIDPVNVTMGYPMKFTSVYRFIKQFTELHVQSAKRDSGAFYATNVLKMLSHPFILKHSKEYVEQMKEEIKKYNLYFLTPAYFAEKGDDFLRKIFTKLPKKDSAEHYLHTVMDLLFTVFDKRKDEEGNTVKTVHNEYIQRAYTRTKRLKQLFLEYPAEISLQLTGDLLLQILRSDQISFEGDAVEGMQLMGLMESRNLDFKNVVLLGFNEGNIPKISHKSTFLSQSIRFAYGLPLIKHQDAVYAYLFYRLLQRSENIKLVYNNVLDESNSGEISRFGLQLLYESGMDISRMNFSDQLISFDTSEIRVSKNEEVLKRLEDFTSRGNRYFSPAALNTYLRCSLKFFLKYLAKIKKPDELDDEFSSAVFGTLLHRALESIYADLSKVPMITFDDIQLKLGSLSAAIDESAEKMHHEDYIPGGSEPIIKEIVKKYIEYVLKKDQSNTPFQCIHVEEKEAFACTLDIMTDNGPEKIKLNGIIDRIDKIGDIYQILDYKTGLKKDNFSSFEAVFERDGKDKSSHVFQALFYAVLFKKYKGEDSLKIKPAVYYTRFMNRSDYSETLRLKVGRGKYVRVDEKNTNELLYEFEKELKKLLSEIFSPDFDFTQTEEEENCRYCEFLSLCGRQAY